MPRIDQSFLEENSGRPYFHGINNARVPTPFANKNGAIVKQALLKSRSNNWREEIGVLWAEPEGLS